jgi:hypothetical protein
MKRIVMVLALLAAPAIFAEEPQDAALQQVLKTATPQQKTEIQAILLKYELRTAPLPKQLQELQDERDKQKLFRLI